ncbi:OsmC family protein [Dactylosporangium siamense]|jgi:osmotically inducible protein OsmC|uniref:Peroxiredoxin n=1 Tax=Dactylosporangium siamense TaxID=685454 RepID=A0A919UCA3_9ACTN|nr:OsmC family protein [Dactylosporangium siamense]GIG46556.1 peroxiredoxin [Dactylosporangium siamense]
MPTRTSSARWEGDLKSGAGTVSTGSGTFQGSYSFPSRFESGEGTNPEELIAAAHAACFSMAFSNGLAKAGFTPTSVETTAAVQFGPVEGGFAITRIDLTSRGDVPGIDAGEFDKIAAEAKAGCPISKALAAVEITLDAKLV